MSEIAISIKGLRKEYRIADESKKKIIIQPMKPYPVINGIDLEIHKGEIVGIIGRNGCGKSTFLKLISTILKPTEGTIEVYGKVASILEMSMGFHNDLTGVENIFLRSSLYHIPRKNTEEKLEEIIKYADLGEFINNPVRTYSSGMRAKLAFSIMINVDADIFLVDEALSTGDAAFALKSSEHLKNLMRQGKTVLFTSHSMGAIESTCSRAVWLDKGKVFMDGQADVVCAEYNRSIMESFEMTRDLAEGGASSAQYRLASFYRDGLYVEKNEEEYLKWLKEAARREHVLAMAEYADILMEKGGDENLEQATKLYRGSADHGNYDARRKYAALVTGAFKNYGLIGQILEQSAATGDHIAMFEYGSFLYNTALSREEYKKAFEAFSAAEENGNFDAKFRVALMFRDGIGVERDIDTSVEKLVELASVGHPKAMTTLAELYGEGKYIQIDKKASFEWYERSAMIGNAKSQYTVAAMYRDGIGVEKDEEKAAEWFRRYADSMVADSAMVAAEYERKNDALNRLKLYEHASDCYNVKASQTLAQIYLRGTGADKDESKAFLYSERASRQIGRNCALLAECYLNGIGVEKDVRKAMELYKIAADTGDARSMYSLAMLYKEDTESSNSNKMYRKYIRMAANKGNPDAQKIVLKWDKRNEKRSAEEQVPEQNQFS